MIPPCANQGLARFYNIIRVSYRKGFYVSRFSSNFKIVRMHLKIQKDFLTVSPERTPLKSLWLAINYFFIILFNFYD